MDELFCSLYFGFQVSCPDDDLPDALDYVVAVSGTIIVHDPPDDQDLADIEVGTILSFVIQTARASNDGVSLLDICDAHSSTLEGMFATIFDTKTEEPREELGIEPLWTVAALNPLAVLSGGQNEIAERVPVQVRQPSRSATRFGSAARTERRSTR